MKKLQDKDRYQDPNLIRILNKIYMDPQHKISGPFLYGIRDAFEFSNRQDIKQTEYLTYLISMYIRIFGSRPSI